MEISDVIRGDDHISNTPKQIMIYEAFGWEPPRFGHMSLIVNEERNVMGKFTIFIEQYRDLGYLPEALNFIALLGWSPEGEEEIFLKKNLSKSLMKSVCQNHQHFSIKLAWVNNQYMKQKDTETVFQLALPHLIKANLIPEVPSEEDLSWGRKLIALYQKEMSYAGEIVPLSEMFLKKCQLLVRKNNK